MVEQRGNKRGLLVEGLACGSAARTRVYLHRKAIAPVSGDDMHVGMKDRLAGNASVGDDEVGALALHLRPLESGRDPTRQ